MEAVEGVDFGALGELAAAQHTLRGRDGVFAERGLRERDRGERDRGEHATVLPAGIASTR
jgi:hypothetical protein